MGLFRDFDLSALTVSQTWLFASWLPWQLLHLAEVCTHVFVSLHTLHLCVFVSWFLEQMRHLEVFLHVKLSCPNCWHFVHCINVLNWNFVVFIWFVFTLSSCKKICNSFSSLMFNITDEKGFFKCIAETHLKSFANFIPRLYFSMSTFSACMSVANQVFMPCARILCHVSFLAIFIGFTMGFPMCWCLIKSFAKLFFFLRFDDYIVWFRNYFCYDCHDDVHICIFECIIYLFPHWYRI